MREKMQNVNNYNKKQLERFEEICSKNSRPTNENNFSENFLSKTSKAKNKEN